MVSAAEKLTSYLKENFSGSSVLLCFSGGVDSGVLAFLLKQAGIPTILFYAKSPIRGRKAYLKALKYAEWVGLPFLVSNSSEYLDEDFKNSPDKRCYICKKNLFKLANENALRLNLSFIFDGTNKDDLKDFRPGLKAAKEEGIISPFVKAGIGKEEILEIKKMYKLPLPEEATTCFATRFVSSEAPLDEGLFNYIEETEEILRASGFNKVRVRVSVGEIVLQVDPSQVSDLLKIKKMIKYPIGYNLTVDKSGYRPAGEMINKNSKGDKD